MTTIKWKTVRQSFLKITIMGLLEWTRLLASEFSEEKIRIKRAGDGSAKKPVTTHVFITDTQVSITVHISGKEKVV